MLADPHWAAFLEGLGPDAARRMHANQDKLNGEQQKALLQTWSHLTALLESRKLTIKELVSGVGRQPESVTTLLFAYLNQRRQALKSPTDDQLNDELGLFIFLLRILGLEVPTGLTLKRHPKPKQAFPKTSAEDLALAGRLPGQLAELFSQIYQGKAPLLTPEEAQGALALALVLESGVHGLGELRAALTHARTEPIRATRGLRYFWLKLGESRGVVLEHRRTFLTPLTAAIALGLHRESPVSECDIKSALRVIGRRLGYRRQRLSITGLARAASTMLRAKREVAQFIVDYADQLFVCHSVGEQAWRRIVKLCPWPDEVIEDDATSRAQEPEPPEDELVPTTPPIRADALYRTSKVLNTAKSTEASLERLNAEMSELRAQCAHLPILQELLTWLMTLHSQPSSNGQVRRIRSIRNLFNGLAARAVAVYRDRPIHSIDSEEWLYVLDAITDDPISESWRNTIRYAVYHFLSDLTERRVIPQSPFKEAIGRAGSAVNANVLTPEEFDRCTKFLLSRHGAVTSAERACGFVLSMCWHYGLRRAEALGLLAQEGGRRHLVP
ncbi:MAG TPA: hypothetical protein DDW98_15735, partial [Gammaproteobacteria bacterium]|nr:hypothetical protein [Gammaproteobacteria bacterium]